MSFLELRDLQKRYAKDGPLVVDHMDLSIEKGEFIVFLGPSGCGKTTTIRMISGLEDVSGGDILIDGESVLSRKPKDRGVSMIFQSYAIWPHMTVFDNIAYPLKLQKIGRKEIKAKAEAAARATGIESFLNVYPGRLSGGQRQRVAVSRAIAVKPKLFLMDEPLSNLDAKLRVAMRAELKRICRQENSTTIFVTHDQAEAMSLADRIVIMRQGKIEQTGRPMDVYRNSATKFAASFIGTPPANFFNARIEKDGGTFVAVNPAFRFRVPPVLSGGLDPYAGKEAVMGVRPEFIGISPGGEKTPAWFCDAEIDLVEPQGNCAILTARAGAEEIKIVSYEYMDLPAGTPVSLSVREGEAMFFDPVTGLRIR